MKGVKTFRPDLWLIEDVLKYANVHQLTNGEGDFCFSKALHGFIRDLKQNKIEYDKVSKDINIYRGFAEKLAKETKPFRCKILNEETTILACYLCQSRTKEDPKNTPADVVQCPRNRPLADVV